MDFELNGNDWAFEREWVPFKCTIISIQFVQNGHLLIKISMPKYTNRACQLWLVALILSHCSHSNFENVKSSTNWPMCNEKRRTKWNETYQMPSSSSSFLLGCICSFFLLHLKCQTFAEQWEFSQFRWCIESVIGMVIESCSWCLLLLSLDIWLRSPSILPTPSVLQHRETSNHSNWYVI